MARSRRHGERQAPRVDHADRLPRRARLPAAGVDRVHRSAGLPGRADGRARQAAQPRRTGALMIANNVLAAESSITVGDHPTVQFLGMTFNVDTMYTTVIAAVITCVFLYWVARRASAEVPNKMQVAVEAVITQTRNYVQDAVGHEVPSWLVPLGVCLFFFILFC